MSLFIIVINYLITFDNKKTDKITILLLHDHTLLSMKSAKISENMFESSVFEIDLTSLFRSRNIIQRIFAKIIVKFSHYFSSVKHMSIDEHHLVLLVQEDNFHCLRSRIHHRKTSKIPASGLKHYSRLPNYLNFFY